MDGSGKAPKHRTWGWVVAAVGIVLLAIYWLIPQTHHPFTVSAAWGLLVYGGMSVRLAGVLQRVEQLEARAANPPSTATT